MSVLLLHGFTGHPSNLEPLEEAFTKQGFSCLSPMLPGHDVLSGNLDRATMQDWLSSVENNQSDVVVGLSMGALLAILMAAERPRKKLVLISPAFVLRLLGRLSVFGAYLGLGSWVKSFPKIAGSDVEDPIGKARCQAYPEVPLKALKEFDLLRQKAIQVLPKLRCPIYSFFGAKDHTVDVQKSAVFVKNPVIFERSAHIIPLDYDQKELIAQCLQILEK